MDALLLSGIVACLIALSSYYTRKNRLRLPPGPKGLPIIGNAWDLAGDGREWLTYQRWGREYSMWACSMIKTATLLIRSTCLDSDILHLRLFSTSVIVLNSAEATFDLLEKRSSMYSDR